MASLSGHPARPSSAASSSTVNPNDNEGFGSFDGIDNDYKSQRIAAGEDNAKDIEEGDGLLEKGTDYQATLSPPKSRFGWAVFWIVVNTLATIGIVCFPLVSILRV